MATILGDPEALAAEVSRRAHHRAVEVAEEARQRAAAIVEDGAREAESLKRQSAEAEKRQVAAVVRRNAARAELEAHRHFIQLREASIMSVWRAAEQRLREVVHQPIYRDVLKRCALHAARGMGSKELILAADPVGHELLSPETLEQWSQEAGVRFRRAQEPAPVWGGLLAVDGRNWFNATFPAQLGLAQSALRERVFQILSKEIA